MVRVEKTNSHVFKILNSVISMMICHEDMVMLRSTTGPYRQLVIEVAYGEMIFSLHWSCMGDDSSKKVVGVSAWCIAHVQHTRVNTSVNSMYYFSVFNIQNLCICILFFLKSICNIKEHWWSLTLSWPDEVQRMILTVHEPFKYDIDTIDYFHEMFFMWSIWHFIMFYLLYVIFNLKLLVYSPFISSCMLLLLYFLTEHYFAHILLFNSLSG